MQQIKWNYRLLLLICLLGGRCVLAADSDGGPGTLTVENAVEQALNSDLILKQSAQDVAIANQELLNTRKTIAISGRISQPNHSLSDADITSLGYDNGKDIGATITLNPQWSIEVDRNETDTNNPRYVGITYSPFQFQQLTTIKKQEYELASKTSNYEQTKVKLITDVRVAYAEVIQKKKLLECNREHLLLATEHCNHVQSRYNLGKVLAIDLTEAKQEVKTAAVNVTSAELEVTRSLLKLNKLTGLALTNNANLAETKLAWGNPDQVDFVATRKAFLANSPELKTAEQAIAFSELQNKVTRLQWASDWSISARQQWEDYTLGSGYRWDNEGHMNGTSAGYPATDKTFYLTLNGKLYDQKNKGQKEIAALNLEKSKQAKENYLSQTAKDLETAYKSWEIASLSLKPSLESIELAKEKLRITTLKFNMGLASADDVNDARGNLLKTEQHYWEIWLNLQNTREQFYSTVWGAIKYN